MKDLIFNLNVDHFSIIFLLRVCIIKILRHCAHPADAINSLAEPQMKTTLCMFFLLYIFGHSSKISQVLKLVLSAL